MKYAGWRVPNSSQDHTSDVTGKSKGYCSRQRFGIRGEALFTYDADGCQFAKIYETHLVALDSLATKIRNP
jgi:hypothetical protein